MSKLNAFRIINLNYNNNAIRVDDELWHFDGESTLISLRNGGGKSVLVQMLGALFVHKKYRNAKERTFASYFTTNKPTFLMVEWRLDDQAGYVLTGMMVRKHQASGEEETSAEELDMVNFICEYTGANSYDIQNIPVVSQTEEGKKLKGFATCQSLFNSWKNDPALKFFAYDMNNATQSRNYFNKLEEYQIYCKEWENITHKINLEESGLSKLFADAKDERGLIEKWFLDAVETKLNKNENRMKEFRRLMLQFVRQYKENQSKIEKKALIEQFAQDMLPVRAAALDFAALVTHREELAGQIARLQVDLRQLEAQAAEEASAAQQTLKAIVEDLIDIQYDQRSWEICRLEDEQAERAAQEKALEQEYEQQKRAGLGLKRQLAVLECARRQVEYREASENLQVWENRLQLLDKQEEDLQPRREQLGYTLRYRYEEKLAASEAQRIALDQQQKTQKQSLTELAALAKTQQNMAKEQSGRMGRLIEQLQHYDQQEQAYNRRFGAQLARNLLGEYEPGLLEIASQEETKQLQLLRRQQADLNRQKENDKTQEHLFQRQLQDKQTELGRLETELKACEQQQSCLQEELVVRQKLLGHVGLAPESVMDTQTVLLAFQKRSDELTESLRRLLNQEEALAEEYRRLENGQLLELPEELAEALEALGCHVTFGMEWLRKNGFSLAENQALVEANPFIPYSLLMSRKDMLRLKNAQLDIATAYPIPIVPREALAQEEACAEAAPAWGEQVSFYVLFDQALLDREALARLLAQKQAVRDKVHAEAIQRESEVKFYRDKADIIKGQQLNRAVYAEAGQALAAVRLDKTRAEEAARALREQIGELEQQMEACEKTLSQTQSALQQQEQKTAALDELKKEYVRYRERLKEQALLAVEIQKLNEQQVEAEQRKKELEENIDQLKDARHHQQSETKKWQERVDYYCHFEERPLLTKDLEDMESEYQALTDKVSVERKEAEKQRQEANERFNRIHEDLVAYSKSEGLISNDYETVDYDRYQVEELKDKQAQQQLALEKLTAALSDGRVAMGKLETKIEYALKQLKEQLGFTAPKPREAIVAQDFERLLAEKRHEQRGVEAGLALIGKRQALYQENITILAEFDDAAQLPGEAIIASEQLMRLTREELDRLRGQLVRDFRSMAQKQQEARLALDKLMGEMSRVSVYQEDFFRKPLLTLGSLTAVPGDFLTQLEVTLASYSQLLEKLAVDIAIIEQEKDKVQEMFLSYLADVHRQLGSIDKNSTIRVRERSLKMLRLELPDWTENEAVYAAKLKAYLENLTDRCVRLLGENQNVEDLISAQITTCELYDAVVGIGNIEVKLYKIEAQREYPIRWADVASNSGGEGFLSAFIILSSLLSFLRRTDSDLFGEREESKVLVMDNPFAQTNAAHLLIPMMDMAKKTNTQLICLTGLGGDSIYSRFDNIYVLTLVSSGLNRGLDYLRGERIKGVADETQRILSAQIQTEDMEQLNLF